MLSSVLALTKEQRMQNIKPLIHHNKERPHKGLDYCRPIEPESPPPRNGPVRCHERLGGLLKSYYREAA